jgi:hypothetical protein
VKQAPTVAEGETRGLSGCEKDEMIDVLPTRVSPKKTSFTSGLVIKKVRTIMFYERKIPWIVSGRSDNKTALA